MLALAQLDQCVEDFAVEFVEVAAMSRTPPRFSLRRAQAAVSEPAPAPASSKRTVFCGPHRHEVGHRCRGEELSSSCCRLLGFSMPRASWHLATKLSLQHWFALSDPGVEILTVEFVECGFDVADTLALT